MPDEHCRITVVGERRKVDLAVPAGAAITTYVGTLARLCAEPDSDIMPAAWSLATAINSPFAPERSLSDLGVLDGQVLYLCNAIADEFADPVVHEVGERAAEVAEGPLGRTWDAGTRTMTLLAVGLLWAAAALIVFAARRQASGTLIGDLATLAGLSLPGLAWLAGERRWALPARVREALALSAVPILGLAARMPSEPMVSRMGGPHAMMTPTGLSLAVLLGGALLGALLAYGGAPGVLSCAVLLAALIAAVLGALLAALRATGVECAAAGAVLAFWLLTTGPVTVGRIVAFEYQRAAIRADGEQGAGDTVPGAVRAATTLLVVWTAGLSALIAAALVPMAASRSPYAAAAAGCLGLGLLARAGTARLLAEAAPPVLAGLVGLFTLLAVGPGHLGWPSWPAPLAVGLIALALPAHAFRRMMRRPRPVRPRSAAWLSVASSVLGGAAGALAVTAFGIYGSFVGLGHHL